MYRHIKTGKQYWIVAHAINATNAREDERLILYVAEGNDVTIYARKEEEFFEKFEEVIPVRGG